MMMVEGRRKVGRVESGRVTKRESSHVGKGESSQIELRRIRREDGGVGP